MMLTTYRKRLHRDDDAHVSSRPQQTDLRKRLNKHSSYDPAAARDVASSTRRNRTAAQRYQRQRSESPEVVKYGRKYEKITIQIDRDDD